ncbi:hypothetical protein [Gelidibacter salicanalis]|uniref:HNH nuclease domain-containing protein n=1 Tax=Gelidibacter salicanalis TaxID=291193 RepID=A0A934NJZ7_9FLAO|nr:hypothetical protein [Gelidibacter salicanalis]MBJ7882299.1 hypothetical protein [Gelidibacter salicanalis]
MNKFRQTSPARTFKKVYKSYRSYKKYLAEDFNNRCGYTDCPDFWFGGKNNFHIDHFKPFSKNPELATEYSNLVYCCSYVNILKSDDEGDYLDPCNIDFNDHFDRARNGTILPKNSSAQAKYMHSKLNLGLSRYSLIWKLDEINDKLIKLQKEIANPKNAKIKNDLRIVHSELAEEFINYLQYLKVNQ